jgi:hypothetical protein
MKVELDHTYDESTKLVAWHNPHTDNQGKLRCEFQSQG